MTPPEQSTSEAERARLGIRPEPRANPGPERQTHGRHCLCTPCCRQDWSDPYLAPCGMHGSSCPPVYDPYERGSREFGRRPSVHTLNRGERVMWVLAKLAIEVLDAEREAAPSDAKRQEDGMKGKSYTATSNTRDCFTICVGRRVIGVLFDALPANNRRLAAGNKTLVFADGYGLTISSNGSYWTETKDDIAQAVERKRDELGRTHREIEGVLALAGDMPR